MDIQKFLAEDKIKLRQESECITTQDLSPQDRDKIVVDAISSILDDWQHDPGLRLCSVDFISSFNDYLQVAMDEFMESAKVDGQKIVITNHQQTKVIM